MPTDQKVSDFGDGVIVGGEKIYGTRSGADTGLILGRAAGKDTGGLIVDTGNRSLFNDTGKLFGFQNEDTGRWLTDPATEAALDLFYRDTGGDLERLPIGDTGQGLIVSSTTKRPAWGDVSFQNRILLYTSSDTWTKPAGISGAHVWVVGGGGGGGGASAALNDRGSGGGGAGASYKNILAADLGNSITVTVGAAGAGASAGNSSGSSGGTTSFGSHLSATGGGGGVGNQGGGGSGGSGSNGDFNFNGGGGDVDDAAGGYPGGFAVSGNTTIPREGAGTFLALLSGATPGRNTSAGSNGVDIANYGFGGGGEGAYGDGGSDYAGGDGGPGAVLVWEY